MVSDGTAARERSQGRPAARVLALLGLALVALVFGAGTATAQVRVWAVGDGGVPGPEDDAAAARVQQEGIDRLLYLGDVYEHGTAEEYRLNYHPSWGRFKAITSPTPGNHEWGNRAVGYDPYWGRLAPQNGGGHYYSFDLAGWHFVSLNSHEDSGPSSAQAAWLSRDLRSHGGTCTVGFHHRPRYSVGPHGDAADLEPLYARLAGRATLLLSGHEHNYQRLQPQRGIVPIVVGTGGRHLYALNRSNPRLVSGDDRSFGALRMAVAPGRLDFRFVRTDGSRGDGGTIRCRPHPARVRVSRPLYGGAYRGLRNMHGQALMSTGPVGLSIMRRVGRRCTGFAGRRFVAVSCSRPPLNLRASGARFWSYRVPSPRGLPRGGYRLTVGARDHAGRLSTGVVRFNVR